MTSPFHHQAPTYDELLDHMRTGPAVIGVVGLGYVGLPLCNAFQKAGLSVLGVDIDPVKIEKLDRGEPYLKYTDDTMASRLAESVAFSATTDFARLAEVDAIFVCVPTPLGPHREPDLSYVRTTACEIGAHLRAGQLVVLESTTYPGTTREVMLPELVRAHAGLVLGQDVFVAYSPEREDPGRSTHTTESTPKLVGGLEPRSTSLAEAVYSRAVHTVHPVASAEIAEAAKILENTFRAVNVALVNELKMLLLRMGIDVFEVIRAAATKPFGYMPFYPGPGLGGHCIPIDPFYLTWKAREHGISTRFVELAGEVNSSMPGFVVLRIADALNERSQCVRGSKVLLLGLAYKKDVDDVRESPSFEIAHELIERGADVSFADPHVEDAIRERNTSLSIERVELTPAAIRSFDVVVVLTDHSQFPYDSIQQNAALIVDTRGVFSGKDDTRGNIVQA